MIKVTNYDIVNDLFVFMFNDLHWFETLVCLLIYIVNDLH